jgi:hypothetical protein
VEEGESLSLGLADSLNFFARSTGGFCGPTNLQHSEIFGRSQSRNSQSGISSEIHSARKYSEARPRWRVSVQLVDAERRRIVLSDRHDLTLGNIFDVQDEIGRRVANSLEARFSAGEFRARHRFTGDRDAYDEYFKENRWIMLPSI